MSRLPHQLTYPNTVLFSIVKDLKLADLGGKNSKYQALQEFSRNYKIDSCNVRIFLASKLCASLEENSIIRSSVMFTPLRK